MLPIEDAIAAGEELRRRFGLQWWQFTITATDANRFALRLARHISGRSKVVVHDHNYHGSVDETFASLDERGEVVPSKGNTGPAVDPGADHAGGPIQRHPRARARPRRPATSRRSSSSRR